MVDPRAAAGACRRMAFVYEFEAADEFDMIDTDVPTTLRRPKADFEGSKAVSSSGHALLHAHACMHACVHARRVCITWFAVYRSESCTKLRQAVVC